MSLTIDAQAQRSALVMVLTSDFLPGARVAVSSFLSSNQWFEGDIVIVEPAGSCAAGVSDLWSNVTPRAPRAEMRNAMSYANEEAFVFYAKGEALALTGYDHVIVADADLLFLDSIFPALNLARPLAAAPDRGFILGQRRSARDYTLTTDPGTPALSYTFCAGLMVFDGTHLGPGAYQAYLEAMRIVPSQREDDGFDDQALLNVLYANQVTALGQDYNFMVSAIDHMDGSLGGARVVHFNAIGKPWLPAQAAPYALSHQEAGRAYRLWAQAWKAVGPAPS